MTNTTRNTHKSPEISRTYWYSDKRLKRAKGDKKGEPIPILRMAQHITRETKLKSNIDPIRSHLNQVIFGKTTAAEIYQEALDAYADFGYCKTPNNSKPKTLRHDAVHGVGVVFSLPSNSDIREDAYFSGCLHWAFEVYKGDIISGVIHRDEAHPHLHLIVLPFVNGRMAGSAVYGSPYTRNWRRQSFIDDIAKPYGLIKPEPSPLDMRNVTSVHRHLRRTSPDKYHRLVKAYEGYYSKM